MAPQTSCWLLVEGPVPDANRACALVAVEVVQDPLLELPLAADAVHDLQVVPTPATSAMNEKKSSASQSKPRRSIAQRVRVESRIQV